MQITRERHNRRYSSKVVAGGQKQQCFSHICDPHKNVLYISCDGADRTDDNCERFRVQLSDEEQLDMMQWLWTCGAPSMDRFMEWVKSVEAETLRERVEARRERERVNNLKLL